MFVLISKADTVSGRGAFEKLEAVGVPTGLVNRYADAKLIRNALPSGSRRTDWHQP
jgi:hypothetical protein